MQRVKTNELFVVSHLLDLYFQPNSVCYVLCLNLQKMGGYLSLLQAAGENMYALAVRQWQLLGRQLQSGLPL